MHKLIQMLVEASELGESIHVKVKAKACIMLETTVKIINIQALQDTIIIITDSDAVPTISLERCKGYKYNAKKKCFKCSKNGIKMAIKFL